MPEALKLSVDSDGVATILFDLADKPVNTMTRRVWGELDAILNEIEQRKVKGAIIASGKPKIFVAGADLTEIRAMSDEELRQYLVDGQRIYARLEALKVPTVAAINGDALGGGLELALACKMRVAADDAAIQIGLPETKVGLIPGWGGTVRLPRLIGLANALPLMLTGKSVNGADALKVGLVNRVVPRSELLDAAREMLGGRLSPAADANGAKAAAGDSRPPEENLRLLDKAKQDHIKKFDDYFPAPLRLIEVVRTAIEKGPEAGLSGEVQGLIDMRNSETGKNLLRVFFMRGSAKKDAAKAAGGTPREVHSAVVFGGGTMGSGIAYALIKSGIKTTIVEANEKLCVGARSRLKVLIDGDVRSGRMTNESADKASSLLRLDCTPNAAADANLVIEAIIEEMAPKLALFRQLDEIVPASAILATNTSSLSVSELAAATSRPSRVVGIHFFNPVPRMPLVEIVRTPHADADALATAVSFAGKLGKTPVVCNDSPGFVVNRALFPYLHEAVQLCEEGFDIVAVDQAMKQWGWPMGPFTLMDEIGLDVVLSIFYSFEKAFGAEYGPSRAYISIWKQGFNGRKNNRGFYNYSGEKGVAPQRNGDLLGLFNNRSQSTASLSVLQSRLMTPMAREAEKLLAERVVDDAEAIDVATIMGLGFPGFRGGLATWMRSADR